MKTMFLNKSGVWLTVLLAGVALVAAGLIQLSSGFNASKEVNNPSGQNPLSKAPGNTQNGKQSQIGGSTDNTRDTRTGKPNEFFVEYRLERDRTRSQQIDLFREIVNNQNSPEETRKEAQRRLLAITQSIDTEMKLENLIRAENFKDAVVFVQEKSATVIVQTPLLTPLDKNKLTDIAVRITGLSSENIVILAKV